MSKQSRRESADAILADVMDYLEIAKWTVDDHTLFHRDPVTNALYPTDTAFCIQIGRDLSK